MQISTISILNYQARVKVSQNRILVKIPVKTSFFSAFSDMAVAGTGTQVHSFHSESDEDGSP